MATKADSQPRRIEVLARPKRVPPEYLEDRRLRRCASDICDYGRSVYWVDYLPPHPGHSGITNVIASPRLQELARHRRAHNAWRGDRPTPIWPVNEETKNAPTTERIAALSRHKTIHLDHRLERSPYMCVSDAARTTLATQRLEQLAVPKQRQDRFGVYETQWGQHNPVSPSAMQSTHTERIETLAGAKAYHSMFRDERPVEWMVEKPALNAIATLRLQQLARPRSRTMIKDDYDPYKISTSAKRARVTPRVDELCIPLPRKVRAKKIM